MQNKPLFILKTQASGKPFMDYIKSDEYLVSSDGQIRFTEQGIRDLGDYFSRAGISIHIIKTYKEYREARALAAPYFMDYLDDRVRQIPDHGEYALLKSLTFLFDWKIKPTPVLRANKIITFGSILGQYWVNIGSKLTQ